MGYLEQESKKRTSKVNLQKAILSTIFTVGSLSISLMAPKITKVLEKLEPDFIKSKFGKYSFNRSLVRLRENGLIVWEKTSRGSFVRLTTKGEAKLRQLELNNYKIKKPKRWDGKWRLLAFDIREERKE